MNDVTQEGNTNNFSRNSLFFNLGNLEPWEYCCTCDVKNVTITTKIFVASRGQLRISTSPAAASRFYSTAATAAAHSNTTPHPRLSLSHPAAPLCPILSAFSHLELCRSRLATGSAPFSLGLGARSAVALTLSRVWWRSTATRRATRDTWLSEAHLIHSKSTIVGAAAVCSGSMADSSRVSDTAPVVRGQTTWNQC